MIEGLGIALYFFLLCYRGFTAENVSVEKYMNLGIVNSILRSPTVPPTNMWFASVPLNYYYLGHWTLALLSRLSNCSTFDLPIVAPALITVISLQACLTFLQTLLPQKGSFFWGFIGAYLLLFCGPLNDALLGFSHWHEEWQKPFTTYVPSFLADPLRPLGNQFEVPATALLWGELHAHFLGLPLTLLFLTLLAQRALTSSPLTSPFWIGICAIFLGSSYATNSWQYPPLIFLTLVSGAKLWWRSQKVKGLLWAGGEGILLIGGSLLTIAPFLLTFETFSWATLPNSPFQTLPSFLGKIFAWSPVATTLQAFLLALGLPFCLAGLTSLTFLKRCAWPWLLPALLLGILSSFYRPLGLLLLPCIALGSWLFWHEERNVSFGGLLLTIGALLPILCDYIFIPDQHGSRSNTIFKFYLQAWLFLSLAAIILAGETFNRFPLYSWRRISLILLFLLGLGSGSIYPLLRGRQWIRLHGDRWWGLNALKPLQTAYPAEAAAILWLQKQPGRAGILEAAEGGGLTFEGQEVLRSWRISSLTGRATPLGRMAGYVALWQNFPKHPDLAARVAEDKALLREFGSTKTITPILALMAKYQLGYLVWGSLERQQWGEQSREILAKNLPLVWAQGKVQIYGRPATLKHPLSWFSPLAWSAPEVAFATHKNYRWLTKQQGQINFFSEKPTFVRFSFELLESVAKGQVVLGQGDRPWVTFNVEPQQTQRRTFWLVLAPGLTSLNLQTTFPPQQVHNRTLTIAVAELQLKR